MKAFGYVVLILAVFVGIYTLSNVLTTTSKVTNPDRMVYNYEQFHSICNAIVAVDSKLEAQREALENTEEKDIRKMRITNISGLRARRADLISEYNSMANQVTTGFLQGKSLPKNITPGKQFSCQ